MLNSILCKLQSAGVSQSTTLFSDSSNSAYNTMVSKSADSKLIVVRAYAFSLEWEYLLKSYFEKQQDELKGESVSSSVILRANLNILKLYEYRYHNRVRPFASDNSHIIITNVATHIWILKFADIMESPWRKSMLYLESRRIYLKTDTKVLNNEEWMNLKKEVMVKVCVLN